jgi:glycosyltransferase involved in cell wall biosynthesis
MPGPGTSSSSEPSRLALITWDDDSPTGGNIYNRALVGALRDLGVVADLVRVGPSWPSGVAEDREQLAAALAIWPESLVDGVVAGNAPEEIQAAVGAGRRVSVLVHLPLADEVGLPAETASRYARNETISLAAARHVICSSHHTARHLAAHYFRADADVVHPGVDRGRPAAGSQPPRLLCLGAITPTKNQLAFVHALSEVTDLDWRAWIVGSARADADYAAAVRHVAAQLGDRLRLFGPTTGPELGRIWAATDLLVLCSRSETYGLVVSEALAYGIPAVVPAGTGAVEALGAVDGRSPGVAVRPDGLSEVLRDWLGSPSLRIEWRDLALRRRETLPTWHEAAAAVRRILGSAES